MITLSANTFMMLYLLLSLTFILGFWILHHYQSKKRKIITAAKLLRVCEYCHEAYLYDDYKTVSKCPTCKLFNKHS